MSPNDLIFIAALVLVALCAALVGFNFWAALGFALALGLVFYLVQSNAGQDAKDNEKRNTL
jgi:membrane protein implicated in regulation of membrane protease activity